MQRLPLALSSLLVAGSAFANPYTLTLEATGDPVHEFRQRGTTVIVDTWTLTDVPAPPSGTTSWDVVIDLPREFQTVDAPEAVDVSLRCGWGTRNVNTGRQAVAGDATWHPASIEADSSEWQSSGPTGDRNALIALFPDVPTGSVLSSFTATGTLDSPTVVGSPRGECKIEARVSADLSAVDQPVIEPVLFTQPDVARSTAAAASLDWSQQFPSSTSTPPEASEVEALLAGLMDTLTTQGCLVDGVVPDAVGGTYGAAVVTGSGREGTIPDGDLHRPTRSFGVTLANGVTYGGASLFSAYNMQRQVVALGSDDSFLAGRWTRMQGIRGVFHAVVATCDEPSDATAVLDTWFVGGLP